MFYLDDEDIREFLDGILQVSPPAVVSCTTLLGIPLSDWVYIATIIYTIVGICTIIKRHWITPWLRQKKKLLLLEHRRSIYDEQQRRNTKSNP